MRVTKPIVFGVVALFGLGLTTALAADTHGAARSFPMGKNRLGVVDISL